MRPHYRTVIQYNPRHRGLQLALAYTRSVADSRLRSHDIYGFMTGYCGGWAWSDEWFHAGEKSGTGYVSYTPAAYVPCWADDRVGVSGLAGKPFTSAEERLLESIRDYMFRRWTCWTDHGRPDLLRSAQRRLDCTGRAVCYATPGFDWALLEFLHGVTGISFSTIRPRRKP